MPRLQRRFSALASALIVGVGWMLWHLPINYVAMAQYGAKALPVLAALALIPIAETVIMAWVYNNSGQSMLMMLLCHFGITGSAILFGLNSPTLAEMLRDALVSAGIHWLVAVVIIGATGAKRLVRGSQRE